MKKNPIAFWKNIRTHYTPIFLAKDARNVFLASYKYIVLIAPPGEHSLLRSVRTLTESP